MLYGVLKPRPLNIGLDNKAAVEALNKPAEATKQVDKTTGYLQLHKNHPLWKPFQLQTNGDLLQRIWNAINQRGPATATATKLKGHTTQADIDQTTITK